MIAKKAIQKRSQLNFLYPARTQTLKKQFFYGQQRLQRSFFGKKNDFWVSIVSDGTRAIANTDIS